MRKPWTPKRIHYRSDEREAIHQKCGGKCAYCGRKLRLKLMRADHVIPFSYVHQGYRNVNAFKNILPACKTCDSLKKDLSVDEFRVKISKLVAAQGSDSENLSDYYGEESAAFQWWNTDRRFLFEKLKVKTPQFAIEKRVKNKGGRNVHEAIRNH